MGAVASRSLIDSELLKQIERDVIQPSVEGLIKDNLDFKGFLYAGLMLTNDGPKVLEYNCRFGDPEAQAVLPLIKGDFAAYLMSGAKGELIDSLIDFDEGWSICLVLASAGYPNSSRNEDLINGLDVIQDARVYHAGTKKNSEGNYVTNGGRVLAVVGRGDTRESAVEHSYKEA